MHRTTREKTNKEMGDLKHTVNQIDITDIYKTTIPKKNRINILLKCTWTFSRITPILGHKTSPNKLEKIEIMQNTFSNCNGIKLEIHDRTAVYSMTMRSSMDPLPSKTEENYFKKKFRALGMLLRHI